MKSWQPHAYQITAAQHALYNAGAGLFLRPGLGKTAITLAVHSTLAKQGSIKATLVIAPLRVAKSVWPKEAAKWAEFAHLTVSPILGTERERIVALQVKADIYTINVDNVAWLATYRKSVV